jgi:hypothetical protein
MGQFIFYASKSVDTNIDITTHHLAPQQNVYIQPSEDTKRIHEDFLI